jgi:hypothetical protein
VHAAYVTAGESGVSRVGVGVALLTELFSELLFAATAVVVVVFVLFSVVAVVLTNCVGSTEMRLFFE